MNRLREAGVAVSDIYDFVNGSTPLEAVPVLIQLLPVLEDGAIKEGVIRALGDKTARGIAAHPLIEELKRIGSSSPLLGWVIANSLAEIVELSDFEELRSLVRDASLGKAREMLVLALARTRHPDVAAELAQLTDDEAVAGHIVIAAGEIGASQLRLFVERQLIGGRPWVRKEARKALRRIQRLTPSRS